MYQSMNNAPLVHDERIYGRPFGYGFGRRPFGYGFGRRPFGFGFGFGAPFFGGVLGGLAASAFFPPYGYNYGYPYGGYYGYPYY